MSTQICVTILGYASGSKVGRDYVMYAPGGGDSKFVRFVKNPDPNGADYIARFNVEPGAVFMARGTDRQGVQSYAKFVFNTSGVLTQYARDGSSIGRPDWVIVDLWSMSVTDTIPADSVYVAPVKKQGRGRWNNTYKGGSPAPQPGSTVVNPAATPQPWKNPIGVVVDVVAADRGLVWTADDQLSLLMAYIEAHHDEHEVWKWLESQALSQVQAAATLTPP